ncbi:MAG TPA: hypothetical protein VN633_03005 [Bryobacteraceae bacterium]|nr:hypothetical protein [Bryobacteraceae bacterium]
MRSNTIVLNWVDIVDHAGNIGLALLSDHTTSYAEGKEHPLSLVMGWGWEGGFWWGKCSLRGLQEMKYALVPHTGLWDRAELWRETAEWSEPLLSRISASDTGASGPPNKSLLRVHSPGVELTSLAVSGRDLLARFFNAESASEQHNISIGVRPESVEVVELDGRVSGTLKPSQQIQIRIPRFGIKTLRFSALARLSG